MRNTSILDSLFPEIRQAILAATLIRPDKWWYLSELAGHIHTTPSSLQRELSALVQSGILEQRRDGRRVYFKAETRSAVFRELRGIMEKTAGLIPEIQNVLEPYAGEILIAFIYGSVARKTERATSDVDLMIVGNVGLADLSPDLRRVEKRLGREISVTNYTVDEFRRKIARHDHFLGTVMKSGIHLIKGERNDLEAITRPERRQAAQIVEAGTGKRSRNHRS